MEYICLCALTLEVTAEPIFKAKSRASLGAGIEGLDK